MILIEPKVELLKEDNFYSVPFSPVPRDVAGLCADRETGRPAFPSPGPNPDRLPTISGRSGASVQACLIFFRPVRGEKPHRWDDFFRESVLYRAG